MARLAHYLRTHRKRAGFSQDEVAWLLGARSGTKVSRYERHARRPTLETALAYEAVFRVPVRELFAGIYECLQRATWTRAARLIRRLEKAPPSGLRDRKIAMLARLRAGNGGQSQLA